MTIGDLVVRVGAKLDGFREAMSTVSSDSAKAAGAAEQAAARIHQTYSKLGTQMSSVGATMTAALTLPIAGLGLAAIKTAGQMEQTRTAFTTLMKSADAADKHIAQLKGFALTTPFQFEELTRTSRLMQAYGFAAADVVPKLRTIGNAVSALGGGSDVLERVVRSMGEIGTRGKISGEQLRELSRAGIPAIDAVAKKLGVTVAEAQKMVTAGAVDAKTAMDGLLEYMDSRFKGGMEAQSKTVLGSWSNIKDKITFTLADIGTALLPIAKNVMSSVLEPMLENVKGLADGFGKLPAPIQNTVLALAGITAAAPLLMLAFGSMVTNGVAIASVLPKIGSAAGGVAAMFAGLGSKTAGLLVASSQATGTFGELTGSLKGVGAGYTAMVATGVLRVAGWVALAAAVLQAANAHWEYEKAREAADQAGKTQQQKLEQLEKSLIMRAANNKEIVDRLNELRHAYLGGTMGSPGSVEALTKYLQYLRDISKQLGHNITEEQKHAVAIVDIDKMLTDSGIRTMTQRRKDLETAKALYAAVVKEYGAGSVIAVEALGQVKAAQEALVVSLGKVKEGVSGAFKFGEKGLESALLVEGVKRIADERQKFVSSIADAGGMDVLFGKAADNVKRAIEELNKAPQPELMERMGDAIQHILNPALALPPELQSVARALDAFGLSGKNADIELLERQFDALTEGLKANAVSAEQVNRAWLKLMHARDAAGVKLSIEDRKKVVELEKLYGGQIGQTRKEANAFEREMQRTFHAVTRGIASSIVNFKGWGATFKSIAKDTAQGILQIMVEGLFKKLAKELADLLTSTTGVLGSIGKALGGLIGSGGSTAAKIGTTIIDEAGQAVNIGTAAAGAASSGAGAASGAAKAATSGIMSTLGAIGSIGSMVTGIIGVFQSAGMNKSLDVLVNHTLRIFNVVFQMLDEHYLFKGQLFLKLDDIWNSIRGLGSLSSAGNSNVLLGSIRDYTRLQVTKIDEFIVPKMDQMIALMGGGALATAGGAYFDFRGSTFGGGLTQQSVDAMFQTAYQRARAKVGG
jgi:tape measure domain-containing protein